jgi:hypothetical protein
MCFSEAMRRRHHSTPQILRVANGFLGMRLQYVHILSEVPSGESLGRECYAPAQPPDLLIGSVYPFTPKLPNP